MRAGDLRSGGAVVSRAAGIAAYDARIATLGGYGTRITAPVPNGVWHTGILIEAGYGGCQPAWRIDERLARARYLRLFSSVAAGQAACRVLIGDYHCVAVALPIGQYPDEDTVPVLFV